MDREVVGEGYREDSLEDEDEQFAIENLYIGKRIRSKKMHDCSSSNVLCRACNIFDGIVQAFPICRQIDHSKEC